MSAKHTPGRLSLEEVENDTGNIKHLCPVDADGLSMLTVVEHNGVIFAAVYNDADARRLAASWNACDGVSTEHLEDDAVRKLIQDRDLLLAQRDELLQFARCVVRYAGSAMDDYLADKARSAIAKAIGDTK